MNETVHYPHDEMTTFLLAVTTGCSYNKCSFCSMYKDDKYSEVSLAEMKIQLMNGYKYTEKIFLTGADPMAIGFDKMKKVLELISEYLPYCARVASYGAIKSIAKYSVEELSTLRNLGLRLLYIGFETGRDDILKIMNKGHNVDDAITQGKKLNEAQLEFNTIIMYGIAGQGESEENAKATAEMINQFKTKKIITMNLVVFEETNLKDMVKKEIYIPSSRRERLFEIRTLLENLDPQEETIFDTTHPTNIIRIKGKLPRERERLIREIPLKKSY